MIEKLTDLLGYRYVIDWGSNDGPTSYVLVITTAPTSYDYGWTVPIGTGQTTEIFGRLILVDASRAKGQIMRYQSGMYYAERINADAFGLNDNQLSAEISRRIKIACLAHYSNEKPA